MDKDNRIGEWRQASKARAEMLDQRLQRFLKPVASEIAHHLDLIEHYGYQYTQTYLRKTNTYYLTCHKNYKQSIDALK